MSRERLRYTLRAKDVGTGRVFWEKEFDVDFKYRFWDHSDDCYADHVRPAFREAHTAISKHLETRD